MKIEIEVDEEAMVKEIFQNFPEYACYSLSCVGFQYEMFVFDFVDTETGKKHTVTLSDAKRGFKKFTADLLTGKLPGLHLKQEALKDAGQWDAYATDCLLQYCIFGEVIYG